MSGFIALFSLSLKFAVKIRGSEPQSVPGLLLLLLLLTIYSFSFFGNKECKKFDFGIDHLVMSMDKVVSLKKDICYDQCLLLAEFN